ncbi:MAG: hypothetical protein M3N98_13490 [Actinomycetota bacterium]|nr:hypothetical protein [Actinomycetota bacterium]
MTTLWKTQGADPTDLAGPTDPSPAVESDGVGWAVGLVELQEHVAQARSALDTRSRPGLAAIDQACCALNAASDNLSAALVGCGVGTPLGLRLHHLRNRLDAHLLAADALRDADAPEAVVTVLRRTVDFVGVDLEALFAEALR